MVGKKPQKNKAKRPRNFVKRRVNIEGANTSNTLNLPETEGGIGISGLPRRLKKRLLKMKRSKEKGRGRPWKFDRQRAEKQ